MSIAFLEVVFDEFDGSGKSDNCFPVRLSDASLELLCQLRSILLSLSQVYSCLVHSRQASSCFRTVPHDKVRVIFIRYLVRMSASVFGLSNSLLRFLDNLLL